jgi:UDP:flavonoid glycosyltransferase YjiC (YdhE family)
MCTPPQARELAKRGYDTTYITFEQAKKLCSALEANGWVRGNGPEFNQP